MLILADDMGYADASFNGATDIETPNIDSIATDGVTFTNGFVSSPVCAPSRTGMMTSRYQTRVGIDWNFHHRPLDTNYGVQKSETMFPKYLQDGGYRTGIIGKWHLGSADTLVPNDRGFDYFFGMLPGGNDYWNYQHMYENYTRWTKASLTGSI